MNPHAIDGLPPLGPDTVHDYLAPWLDGALPPALAEQVADMVIADPQLTALSDAMAALDTQLPHALAGVLQAPLPITLARTVVQRPASTPPPAPAASRSTGWARIAVAACIAAAVTTVVGVSAYRLGVQAGVGQQAASETERLGWVTQIAGYHRLYSNESRHLVEVGADQPEHIRAWLGDRLGTVLPIPDLARDGLKFRGARLLVVNGQPVAQLMYTGEGYDGPVGYCVLRRTTPDSAPTEHRRDDMALITWANDGYAFVVVGKAGGGDLGRLAEAVRLQI